MAKNRLRQIRHEMMIDKQLEMANLLKISQGQYNRYERDKAEPTLDVALRIAQRLGKSVEDIFYLDENLIE